MICQFLHTCLFIETWKLVINIFYIDFLCLNIVNLLFISFYRIKYAWIVIILRLEVLICIIIQVFLDDVPVSLVINLIVVDHVFSMFCQSFQRNPTLIAKWIDVLNHLAHLIFVKNYITIYKSSSSLLHRLHGLVLLVTFSWLIVDQLVTAIAIQTLEICAILIKFT